MDTYTVRIWRPALDAAPAGVRGTVVHLASGRHLTFTQPDALIAFLSTPPDGMSGTAGQQPPHTIDQTDTVGDLP